MLFRSFERREAILHTHLIHDVHLVNYEPGKLEINLGAGAPPQLAARLSERLAEWTGTRWVVGVSTRPGLPTLDQDAQRQKEEEKANAREHPVVKAALAAFPGATLEVRKREGVELPTDTGEEPPEVPDIDPEPENSKIGRAHV